MGLDAYLRAADPLRVAVRDAERSLTYGELADEAARVAGGLAALGIARGDRAAFLLKNRADALVFVLALARLGAVAVPVSWRLGAGEMAGILADAGARLLLTEPSLEPAAPPAESGALAHCVLAGGSASAGWRSLAELQDAAPVAPGDAGDGDAHLLQIYTSGTTGTPKGAVLTAGNVRAFVATWVRETDLASPDDRVYLGSPLFHVGGLVMAICTLAAGAELRLHPEFEPRLALDTLERERVTHALFVPAMLRWMLAERGVEGRAFPALRRIVYGAAPIPPELLAHALRVFDCGFVQGYGLTETTGALTVLRPEDHAPGAPPERLASAGRPLDCCEVRVVDEHGRDVPAGRPRTGGPDGAIGEVVARGANVFAGYWNLPGASAEAFRDGWFHTGDLARVDADGYLTLVDRKKDMLVVGGENVYPREVEDALLAHPGVADAAVIGVPHDVWGEEVLALVVVPPGFAPPRAFDRILIHHCRERLAVFKCPTRLELRDALPRNAAGKLDKKALREPYWAGRPRRI